MSKKLKKQTLSAEEIERSGVDNFFFQDFISEDLFSRMKTGKSWKPSTPPILREHLRYLHVLHNDTNGLPQIGEMVVNEIISEKILSIFKVLYYAGYRIEKMHLMDDYYANDENAMRDNNTSCFNFRFKSNSTTEISMHGAGLAIDINPLYNPYVMAMNIDNKELSIFDYEQVQPNIIYDIEPTIASTFAFNRSTRDDIPFKIDTYDLCYKLFTSAGFEWGGNWITRKDYQHFEYPCNLKLAFDAP